ncbi:MAG: hypothetical protein OEY77_15250 [Nitrospira sp.]|nr:hypothetical protein [Nitrospira sp.]
MIVKIGLIAALALMITLYNRNETGLAAGKYPGDSSTGQLSILRKLDFSKVAFSVRTQPQFQVRLRDRALDRLRKHGLQPLDEFFKGPVQAVLVLTIDPIPLTEACSGKVLYNTKLELEDDITIKRDSQITLQRVTWSFAPGHPAVLDTVSSEMLLADVDRYIDQFIVSYGQNK